MPRKEVEKRKGYQPNSGSKGRSRQKQERFCRICRCTDMDCRQCIARTGLPCSWVAEDLCSACLPKVNIPLSGNFRE